MRVARETSRTLAELDESLSAHELELWALLHQVEHEEAVQAAQDAKTRGRTDGRGFSV
jgi:hypothetical protein